MSCFSVENGSPAWKMIFQREKWFFSVENGFSAGKIVPQRPCLWLTRK